MRQHNILRTERPHMIRNGVLIFLTGVSMAVLFDSVALHSVGCFIAGIGLGFISKENT